MKLALVGDIHNREEGFSVIRKAVEEHDLTIQLGDFGFLAAAHEFLKEQDPNKFKFFTGNHDDYDSMKGYPHLLGRFGHFTIGDANIFFVCGAHSVDKNAQFALGDWWETEELNWQEANECLTLWDSVSESIDIILSHDCPLSASVGLLHSESSSYTRNLLESMFRFKAPKEWYFGHYHRSHVQNLFGTKFQCLDVNEVVTLEV